MTLTRPLLLGTALLVAGCGDPGSGTLQLSWLFADGRSCTDSGALTVVVEPVVGQTAPKASYLCTAGIPPSSATVDGAPRDTLVTLRALSPVGDELYRGTLTTDPALQPATVTLYATFAR